MSTLRERQLNALKQMLNLNQPLTKSVACEPTWKVLIYDRVGQDVISPLISIKELRELGVTLHVWSDITKEKTEKTYSENQIQKALDDDRFPPFY